MRQRIYVISIDELILQAHKNKYGVSDMTDSITFGSQWNELCNKFYFCQDSRSENWRLEDVIDTLKENPESISFKTLLNIMNEEKLSEIMIIRD